MGNDWTGFFRMNRVFMSMDMKFMGTILSMLEHSVILPISLKVIEK